MKKRMLLLLTLFTLSHAGGCLLVQSGNLNVTWKAYKTLAKVGVGGSFTSVEYVPIAKEGENFRALLVGSTVSIDATQVDTGNPARDKTLVKMFFKQLVSTTIDGKIVAIQADKHIKGKPYTGVLDIELSFNAKKMTIPMRYTYEKEQFHAQGTIDLFDFSANEALSRLNKSCYALHKGKTWSDVSMAFTTEIKATLCNVKVDK